MRCEVPQYCPNANRLPMGVTRFGCNYGGTEKSVHNYNTTKTKTTAKLWKLGHPGFRSH